MKLYFKVVLTISLLLLLYGYLLPILISSASTVDVILGIGLGVVSFPSIYLVWKYVFK